jgi:hypothetical protein
MMPQEYGGNMTPEKSPFGEVCTGVETCGIDRE